MTDQEIKRLLTVGATGAITAIAADLAYSRYGNEIRSLLTQLMQLFAQSNTPTQPGAVGGNQ